MITAGDAAHFKTRKHQRRGPKNCTLAVGSTETTSTDLDEVRVPNVSPVSKSPQDLALDKYQVPMITFQDRATRRDCGGVCGALSGSARLHLRLAQHYQPPHCLEGCLVRTPPDRRHRAGI